MMKAINIKGKEYVMVNERIKAFRSDYPNYSLESEIIAFDDKQIMIKAIIKDGNGRIVATGLAHESKDSSMINKTSYVENCETSAWGRALGNLGIGVDFSIASAEEMINAMSKQEQIEQKIEIIGGEFILNGGKYDGKTINEVIDEDIDYIYYCLKNGKNQNVLANMQKALNDKNIAPPEENL